jgi:glutathione S-transferase
MLKIWGRTNSVNVQKALWCIGELGLAHERIDAGMQYGKNNEDGFLQMNPNGRVPVIDDDGFTLWESNTIVRYLSAKHSPGDLYPESLPVRADSERWMDWQLTVLSPPMTVAFWQLVRTPPERRDMQQARQGAQDAGTALVMLDRHLAGRDYVAGATLSMGDIPVGAMVYRWYALPDIERPELANLRAWYERLSERPAFQTHVMLPLT